jgi:hypothetical protein
MNNLPITRFRDCPGRTDGEHAWFETTMLGEAGKIETYHCSRCRAEVRLTLPLAQSTTLSETP